MTTYSIQAPDGKTYNIDGPAGASDDDVRAQVLSQHPDAGGSQQTQSPLMNALKYAGNEAARVGIHAVTDIPLAFADVPMAIKNKLMDTQTELPSQTYAKNLNASFPPDTSTAGKVSEGLSSVIAGGGLGRAAGMALAPATNSETFQRFLNFADKATGGLDKIAPGLGIAESITHRSAYPMLAAAVPGAIRYAVRTPTVESLVSDNGASTLTGAVSEWLRQEGAIQ